MMFPHRVWSCVVTRESSCLIELPCVLCTTYDVLCRRTCVYCLHFAYGIYLRVLSTHRYALLLISACSFEGSLCRWRWLILVYGLEHTS
jgi:hypothetical protein